MMNWLVIAREISSINVKICNLFAQIDRATSVTGFIAVREGSNPYMAKFFTHGLLKCFILCEQVLYSFWFTSQKRQ